MILLQFTGMSGAGKTTIAQGVQRALLAQQVPVELIDGDVYRRYLCNDLGFSKADRLENVRRLGFVGLTLIRHKIVVIMAVINPYEQARQQLSAQSPMVKTVFIDCALEVLQQRDVKGLYRRAMLPPEHPDHLPQFTGVSDPYEPPTNPDLHIRTDQETVEVSVERVMTFLLTALDTSTPR